MMEAAEKQPSEIVEKNTTEQNQEEKMDIDILFHFNAIPEKDLEEQYMDLSFVVSSSGFGGRFMGMKGEIIKEKATSTLPIDETKNQIQTKFHLKDWQFATQNVTNGVRLVILYPSILKNTKLIKNAMMACGWSLADKGYIIKKRMTWRAMSFGPIFQFSHDNNTDQNNESEEELIPIEEFRRKWHEIIDKMYDELENEKNDGEKHETN